jgi:hypothetical protein
MSLLEAERNPSVCKGRTRSAAGICFLCRALCHTWGGLFSLLKFGEARLPGCMLLSIYINFVLLENAGACVIAIMEILRRSR